MINKSILALVAAVAVAGIAPPAFAQAFDPAVGTGNPLPMVYDAHGAKHRFTFGYYGPVWPALPSNDQLAARQSTSDKIAAHQGHEVRIGARLIRHYD
jgi:hypothetical protein